MATETIRTVQQNTAPNWLITARRNNVAINLTNCTVQVVVARGATITNTGHQSASIITPLAGTISYTPQAGDTPTPGSYKCDVIVNYGDGSQEVLYDQLVVKARKRLSPIT